MFPHINILSLVVELFACWVFFFFGGGGGWGGGVGRRPTYSNLEPINWKARVRYDLSNKQSLSFEKCIHFSLF